MKNIRSRSFTRGHAALIIVLALAFLGLFSISRSSAQEEEENGAAPFPTPLLTLNPQGSLIYNSSAAGNIGFAGDTNSFTLTIDPDQTVTAIVTGSGGLQPRVELHNPASTLIGSATAAAANQAAVLQTAAAPTGGTYTFTVSGAGGSTGNFSLQVVLNAAKELEGTIFSATNNTLADAQNIDSSFINLRTSLASAQRGAVNGVTGSGDYSASAVAPVFEDISATGAVITGLTNTGLAVSAPIPIGFTFPFYGAGRTTVFVSNNGLLTFGAANGLFVNFDLSTVPAQAAIAVFWDDLLMDVRPDSNVLFQVSGSGPDQHLTIQWDRIRFFGTTGDFAGDTITFQAQLFADGRIRFNYQDLVSGNERGNDGVSATVGIKGDGAQRPDRLLLAFNNGPNDFVGSGKSTLITPQPPDDWYSVTVIDGRLKFETSTPADGPGEFVNTLDPHIELYDSTGATLIATGEPLEDGRNESINVSGLPAPATYLIRVTSEGDTEGEYFLGTGAPPTFSGLFPPLGKDKYDAGSTIPVKFSFGLNLGLDILAPGSPVSRQINCSTGVGVGPWEPTQSVDGLQYDPSENQYIYNWKTSNAWADTCRELDVIIRDGRRFRAKVSFK
jgi:hypothetical protein